MSGHSTYQPQNKFLQWIEKRLPIGGLIYSSFVAYPTPRNLNYWWTFGGILSFMLGVQIVKVFWRSKPIFIFHRTKKEIEEAVNVDVASLPDPEPDSERVKAGHEQWLVVIGICTHLGCIPLAHQGEYDGWFCPCHGSQYDTAGRIRKGPAPKNLYLPPYTFLSATKIRIGEESAAKPA